MEAGQGLKCEDFATRMANQAKLKEIMDTELRQLEHERIIWKKLTSQHSTSEHMNKQPERDKTKK